MKIFPNPNHKFSSSSTTWRVEHPTAPRESIRKYPEVQQTWRRFFSILNMSSKKLVFLNWLVNGFFIENRMSFQLCSRGRFLSHNGLLSPQYIASVFVQIPNRHQRSLYIKWTFVARKESFVKMPFAETSNIKYCSLSLKILWAPANRWMVGWELLGH